MHLEIVEREDKTQENEFDFMEELSSIWRIEVELGQTDSKIGISIDNYPWVDKWWWLVAEDDRRWRQMAVDGGKLLGQNRQIMLVTMVSAVRVHAHWKSWIEAGKM